MRILATVFTLLTLGLPAYAATADIVQDRATAEFSMQEGGFPLPVCGSPAGCAER